MDCSTLISLSQGDQPPALAGFFEDRDLSQLFNRVIFNDRGLRIAIPKCLTRTCLVVLNDPSVQDCHSEKDFHDILRSPETISKLFVQKRKGVNSSI
jgi:hypothetical protein